MPEPRPTIVLVYNADSGLFGALTDSVHKIVSPETYACRLCALTYGLVAMRSSWRAYLESLPWPRVFLHRDEFHARYPGTDHPLPAVFLEQDGRLETLLSADALNATDSLDTLIDSMRTALESAVR